MPITVNKILGVMGDGHERKTSGTSMKCFDESNASGFDMKSDIKQEGMVETESRSCL